MAMRTLLVAILAAVGLSACGSNPTPAPTSASPSVPATGQTPVATTPAATASPGPVPSLRLGAAPPTPRPTVAGGTLDVCGLLTTAELAKILGSDRVQVKPMPGGGWVAGQCAWNGPTSGFFLSVGTSASIATFGDPAAPNAKAKLAQFTQQASVTGVPKNVAGIGDGAVLGTLGIAAYTGDTYLQVTNLGLTDAQLIKIMKLAVAHL